VGIPTGNGKKLQSKILSIKKGKKTKAKEESWLMTGEKRAKCVQDTGAGLQSRRKKIGKDGGKKLIRGKMGGNLAV